MKRKIYKLLSSTKQGLFALALTVFSGTAISQTTYTLNYTGSAQNITLQPGTYTVAMWGADGGNGLNGNIGGKGGYSQGTIVVGAATTYYIYVGGKGTTASVPTTGGWNGGGNLVGSFTSGYDCGTGGGGTDIRTTANTTYANRIIVAGGGGGGNGYGTYTGNGGNGGGTTGADGASSRGQTYAGGGATAVAGGTAATGGIGGYSGAGALGVGGDYLGTLGGSAGGGGYYGGGSGHWGGAGGGGSGYIGGVTSGLTAQLSQTGFVAKPIATGDGLVLITALCNVNITSTSSLICSGAAVTLSTNAVAGTYTWSTGSTASSVTVSPTSTTTYTLSGQGTNPSGCAGSAAFVVTVNNSPTVSINSSTTSACLGQSVTLTASGANTYTWNNSVTNGVAFAPSATSLYTVTGTNACGTATAGVTVTVSSLPVTAATSSSLVCAGSPATLTTGGATTYTWMPGTGTQTAYIVNPTANTIYTVTGKTGNCSGVATITVNTNPLPSMTIAPSSTAICYGNTATLSILGNATSYTWSVNGQMIPSIVINPTTTTVYSIIGVNSFNCTRSVSQIITVNPNPNVSINVSNPEVCSGGGSTLTASGTNTYTWGGGVNTASNVVNPITASVYSVTGTNTLTGCFTTTQAAVSVFEPEIAVTANTVICKGSNVIIGATGAITYTWINGGQQNQNITVSPTVSTTYTVSGTVVNLQNGVACPASNTVDVVVNPLPVITASSNTTTICRGTSATITASGAGATGTYTWSNNLGNNPMITVSPILNQTYNVSGTDEHGCRNTATVQVLVVTCTTTTGINSLSANNVNLLIYPNPSNGEFAISSNQEITLSIVNELGQQVKVISLNPATPEVKIKNLANGIYFITGKNENGSVKQKIVIAD